MSTWPCFPLLQLVWASLNRKTEPNRWSDWEQFLAGITVRWLHQSELQNGLKVEVHLCCVCLYKCKGLHTRPLRKEHSWMGGTGLRSVALGGLPVLPQLFCGMQMNHSWRCLGTSSHRSGYKWKWMPLYSSRWWHADVPSAVSDRAQAVLLVLSAVRDLPLKPDPFSSTVAQFKTHCHLPWCAQCCFVMLSVASSHLSSACYIQSFLLQVPHFLLYCVFCVMWTTSSLWFKWKSQVQLPYSIAKRQLCPI